MRANIANAQVTRPTTVRSVPAWRYRRSIIHMLYCVFGGALMVGCGSSSDETDTSANTAGRKTPQSTFSIILEKSISVDGEAVFAAYEPVPTIQLKGAQQNGFSMTGTKGSDFITLNLYQSDPFPAQREIELVNPALSNNGSVLNAFFSEKEWASVSGHVSISVFNGSQIAGTFQATMFSIDNEQETVDVSGAFSGQWTLDCWVKVNEGAPLNENIPPDGAAQVWEQDVKKVSEFCSTVAAQL